MSGGKESEVGQGTELEAVASGDAVSTEWAEGSRELLAAIVSASDDAIVSKSLDGTILSWNAGAERLFGYSAAEMIGQSINLIIPGRLRAEEQSILARLRQGERIDHFETVRMTKDGREIVISLTVSPMRDTSGRIVGASKVGRDITKQRELELALREADRRKDEFLATLSHELRNPLAAISSSLDLLNQAGDKPELVSPARDAIGRQTSHLVRLVDDLLDVSRITRDRIELRKSSVELEQILLQAIELCRPLTEQYGQTIKCEVPDETVHLDADPVRLLQILSNLLTNACNFSPPGGSIRLTATLDGEDVRISVSDNGAGIAPEHLESIFDIFAQGHHSSETPTRGLGVGLSLARRLLELHGGTVRVRSEGLGKGSEFTIQLPLSADPIPVSSSSDNRDVSTACSAMRVLVVDDNVDNAESLSMLLSLNGHETRVAFDGLIALELARQFRPQVVLLDIGLPKMNGLDVCRHIRKEPWGTAIKIIAVTGWGQDIDRQRSADAGFDHHLVKPVQYSHIEQALASSRSGN